MVNNIEELKKLIIWAKEQKIKTLKLAEIHVEFSDLALVDNIFEEQETNVELNEKIKSIEEKTSKTEEEEALYWSAR